MARRKPVANSAIEYISAWRKAIEGEPDPHTLLSRWRNERDIRDVLQVPPAASRVGEDD